MYSSYAGEGAIAMPKDVILTAKEVFADIDGVWLVEVRYSKRSAACKVLRTVDMSHCAATHRQSEGNESFFIDTT